MILNESKLVRSSGLVIIQDNKILLCHPTNLRWWNTYSFPKGQMETGETVEETAVRETLEEIGMDFSEFVIKFGPKGEIHYDNKPKIVYYQVLYCKGIDKSMFELQKEEIDWAGFLTRKDAEKRIFHRLAEVLDFLD